MHNKIELFKMLLKRNKLNTNRHNSYQRYAYAFKNKKKDILKRQKEFKEFQQALYSFTAETHKRRCELRKEFKTHQYKDGRNNIKWIRVNDVNYGIDDMKKVIQDYEIEQILLGE